MKGKWIKIKFKIEENKTLKQQKCLNKIIRK